MEKVAYFDIYVYMYRLAQATQSVSMQGYQKHIQNHIDVIMHLTDFVTEYAKQEGSQKEKIEYISKRIAEMVGEQITIFMSYPVENEEMKQKFIEFDQEPVSYTHLDGFGVNIEPEDVKILADAIEDLYENEEKRLEMGKKARKIAEEQFDRPKSYRKIEELIRELTEKK